MNSPPPEDARDLMLLDALGEATPAQQARLAALLQSDPALAAEHADLVMLSSTLAMNTATLPPIPDHVLGSLDERLTKPAPPAVRPRGRVSWVAIAASLALVGAIAVLLKPERAPAPLTAQTQPPSVDDQPMPMELKAPPAAQVQVQAQAAKGTRRALLLGLEPWADKEKDPERGAGWENLQMMRRVLKKWGFAEENIHQVFNKELTLRNAVSAIETHLIATTKPGDSVMIYWNSHGTQVKDLDGDEPDGLDEAYCPYDFDWSKPDTWFTDDLFAALLARINTRDILVITEACHSGGSTRGIEMDDADAPHPEAISSGFVPLATPNPNAKPHVGPSHVIHLAACGPDELSYGAYGKGGRFTMEISSLLAASEPSALTFRQAAERVRSKIYAYFKGPSFHSGPGYPKTWTPQFEGPVTKKIATFLNPPVPPPEPPPPPPPPLPIWHRQSGDITLNLSTDKTLYTAGDLMTVTVTPDLDCHLRLYYLSADHQVNQIFPNKFQQDGFVKKGQTIALPGPGAAFEFRMGAPFGNEILMAVACSLPFTDQTGQTVQNQLFQEFKDTNLETLSHRGITVEEKKALTGRALHLYRVGANK